MWLRRSNCAEQTPELFLTKLVDEQNRILKSIILLLLPFQPCGHNEISLAAEKALLSYVFPLCFLLSWPSRLPRTAGIEPTRYEAFRVPMEMVQFCVNQEEKKTKLSGGKKMWSITGQFSVYWHSHELKAGAMRTKPPSAPEGPNVLPPHCQYMVWPRRFFFSLGSRWRTGLYWLWDENWLRSHLFAEVWLCLSL